MKRSKNKLSNIIKWELICLAAVTIFVAGLIKWSEGRADSPENGDGQRTVSGTVKAGEGDAYARTTPPGGSQPTGRNPEEMEGGSPAPTGNLNPAGGQDMPSSVPPSDDGREEATPAPTQVIAATVAPKPTEEAAQTPAPTQVVKPQATPVPTQAATQTPAPTTKPQATQTPKPTQTPAPTSTPVPTKAPQGNTAEGMDTDFIASIGTPQGGELLTADGAVDTVYYMQTDARWGSMIYGGEDTIAKYACGPTSMAIVVSSLTDIGIDPLQMSGWAFNNGYWYPQSGSLHSVVNGTAKAFGLKSEGVGNDADTPKKVKEALKGGDMVVVLMGKGHFTKGGHFIVLRGITAEGKILVADCNSRENTLTEWDFETIQSEAKWASDGGPFWIIRNPNIMQ